MVLDGLIQNAPLADVGSACSAQHTARHPERAFNAERQSQKRQARTSGCPDESNASAINAMPSSPDLISPPWGILPVPILFQLVNNGNGKGFKAKYAPLPGMNPSQGSLC